jgi:hypothetical protein
MTRAAKKSTRVAGRRRDHSCPVADIFPQIEGFWREHDRIDALSKESKAVENFRQLMVRLFEATQTMKHLASLTRAQSMAGALFQITLAYDCVLQLQQNKLEEDQQEVLHDELGRLLYSAAGVIKRELPDKLADTGKRYMPAEHDPLVLFERARRRAG